MVLVQQNGNGTLSVNLTKIVIRALKLKKGDQVVYAPIEGNDEEYRLKVIR